ncbi:GNAT family acetyltransferase [Granulosicoccus antarcticus]|uniref:Acetyltransferase YpeA n=1 Tax=Granulosicoccus antarcticus IMCC3135 TaxID=1192854 RepID=A0A2Z2NPM4_9GAMM|nr:GNAT family acetyltransferase [Granulosicoccus antarcticus]ASJ72415.1 Acetyltransferase YpeA [Granulosicoccus antarcticus IMCC3135]
MKIRPFETRDTDEVIMLWEACALTRPWNNPALDIQRKSALDDDLFLVGEKDGMIAGTVMAGYEGHRGWINYLAVAPSARHCGLGKQLMINVEARLLELGCPKINLQIRHGNDAVIAFYEAIGFSTDACVSMGKRLIPDA